MNIRSVFVMVATFLLVACNSAKDSPTTTSSVLEYSTDKAKPDLMPGQLDLSTSLPNAIPTPTTTIPGTASGEASTELKYQVLKKFPNPFFCDPDIYPVSRAGEADSARQHFPELQANLEEFQAILSHNGLNGRTRFTDAQKLLIYREHKKLSAVPLEKVGDQYRFHIRIMENAKQAFLVKGFVDANGFVVVQQREPIFTTCPICLAADTPIDTPQGPVAVQNLHVGDAVWTADAAGSRLSATLLKTAKVAVPADHRMLHIVLSDGRELRISPGHPTSDGKTMGELKPGDILNGMRIARLESVAYEQLATFDILPTGVTGYYWANGILIGSTLANH